MLIKYRNPNIEVRIRGFTLKRSANQRGFTLIELLVTIGLIAVVSAGIMALIGQGPQMAARDAQRKADLQKLATALELYRSDNGFYPKCDNPSIKDCRTNNTSTTSTSNGVSAALSPAYMTTVPTDPMSIFLYRYYPQPAGCDNSVNNKCTGYHLCSQSEKNPLESQGDPLLSVCSATGNKCGSATNGYVCDYYITNP